MTRMKYNKTYNEVLKQKMKIKYDFADEQIYFGKIIYFVEESEGARLSIIESTIKYFETLQKMKLNTSVSTLSIPYPKLEEALKYGF